MAKSTESVPLPQPVSAALAGSPALAHLAQRLEKSRACLEATLPVVPPGLRPHLSAGPWDEDGWTLLAHQAAATAKLRQLAPLIEDALQQAGLGVARLRIRAVLTR